MALKDTDNKTRHGLDEYMDRPDREMMLAELVTQRSTEHGERSTSSYEERGTRIALVRPLDMLF